MIEKSNFKNDFHALTENDKNDLHTRQLYYDLKTNYSR